jgi:2-methylisocitrate lyase-like PEP mutase family enzyme
MHASGCFVLPNPWDIGSARRLQRLGFPAIASTSSGFASSLGREDYSVTRDEVLAHLRLLCEATELPVNADFENAFADRPEEVGVNVALAVETGVAGLSVEDRSGNSVFAIGDAVLRVAAARAAIDRTGADVILVARSEGMAMGQQGLDETIERLRQFAEAGADCLYAIGLERLEDVAAVVAAVAPKPLNVLRRPGLGTADLARVGVRRVSVGGALARAAWAGFDKAAASLAEEASALRTGVRG